MASASWPLLVGIASLVGVDTFLGPPRLPQPVQIQRSVLGVSDYVIGVAVLDPRLAGMSAARPPEGARSVAVKAKDSPMNAALAPHDLAPALRPRAAHGSLVLDALTQPAIAKRGRTAPRRSRSKT